MNILSNIASNTVLFIVIVLAFCVCFISLPVQGISWLLCWLVGRSYRLDIGLKSEPLRGRDQ